MIAKLCYETKIGGMPIELRQQGVDRFMVVYWKQVKRGLTYAQAAAELGACIMHACACEGTLNNREGGERRAQRTAARILPAPSRTRAPQSSRLTKGGNKCTRPNTRRFIT